MAVFLSVRAKAHSLVLQYAYQPPNPRAGQYEPNTRKAMGESVIPLLAACLRTGQQYNSRCKYRAG